MHVAVYAFLKNVQYIVQPGSKYKWHPTGTCCFCNAADAESSTGTSLHGHDAATSWLSFGINDAYCRHLLAYINLTYLQHACLVLCVEWNHVKPLLGRWDRVYCIQSHDPKFNMLKMKPEIEDFQEY